jgi:hypothetical protein
MLLITRAAECIIEELGLAVIEQSLSLDVAVQRAARLDRGPISDEHRECFTKAAIAALSDAYDQQQRVTALVDQLAGVTQWDGIGESESSR